MKRVWVLGVMVAVLGGGACRKKAAPLVKTPITQLDPLGGSAPAPAAGEDQGEQPRTAANPQGAVGDAGVHKKVFVPVKTSTAPSVTSPYVPGGGSEHLPLWRQRAKFF